MSTPYRQNDLSLPEAPGRLQAVLERQLGLTSASTQTLPLWATKCLAEAEKLYAAGARTDPTSVHHPLQYGNASGLLAAVLMWAFEAYAVGYDEVTAAMREEAKRIRAEAKP